MDATRQLHDLGQRLWFDNITRGMLRDGSLRRYIDELAVTGLTSNPTIFLHAMAEGDLYDVPDKTLLAFADHGHVKDVMPEDGGDAEIVIEEFARDRISSKGRALEHSAR